MADQLSSPDQIQREKWDKLEKNVNVTFDGLISTLNERRVHILNEISKKKDNQMTCFRSIKDIEDATHSIQEKLKENLVTDLQNKTISDFSRAKSSLELQSSLEGDYIFVCDTKEFDSAITRLGAIEKPAVEYLSKNQPKLLFSNLPNVTGLSRISVNEERGIVCASDHQGKQILIFSLSGVILNVLKHDQMKRPVSLKIIGSSELIVSDYISDSIYRIEFDLNKQNKCKVTSTRNNVYTVTAIDYDPDLDQVYTTSTILRSVQILDRKTLNLIKKIDHSFLYPQNVIVRGSKIFVLDCNNPCLHVLSKSTHELLRSILLHGTTLNFSHPLAFSLDREERIIVANYTGTHNAIQIYSPSGHLLNSFPNDGSQISEPRSIHVTSGYDVIVVLKDPPNFIKVF